jgi:sortase B
VRKLLGNSTKKKHSLHRGHIIYASMVVVGVFFAAAALRVLIGGVFEDATARTEYELLRESFPTVAAQAAPDVVAPVPFIENDEEAEEFIEEVREKEKEDEVVRALSLDELAAINRDFIGWIVIGNKIDYPVVRGSDNDRYINTTFAGHSNSAGAIFMDYRHVNDFDEQVCIIYGHYTRDGTMFSPLIQYLNPDHLQQYPNITVTTRNGRTLNYRIFAARITDAWDVAYSVSVSDSARATEVFPDVPEDASRFMLLSTCTRSGNNDERILVYAASVS